MHIKALSQTKDQHLFNLVAGIPDKFTLVPIKNADGASTKAVNIGALSLPFGTEVGAADFQSLERTESFAIELIFVEAAPFEHRQSVRHVGPSLEVITFGTLVRCNDIGFSVRLEIADAIRLAQPVHRHVLNLDVPILAHIHPKARL